MPITTNCPCGAKFDVPDALREKKVKCPKCSQPVRVPGEGERRSISVKCTCGKGLQLPAKYAGRSVKCPSCGTAVKVAVRETSDASARIDDLLDEVDLKESATGRRCPNCRGDLVASDVICVACGYNTETGKQLKTKTSKVLAREPVAAALAAATAGQPAREAPPVVKSLAKMLNQLGMLGVLAAVGYAAYQCYSAFSLSENFATEQIIDVMTGSAGYVLAGVLILLAVPCALAANWVQDGKPVGRFLSMAMGVVGLVGLITTLPAILVLKLAFSDEVARHCE